MADKKLFRSSSDKKLCGVCAGLAKYFDLDPTIMRVIFIVLFFCGCVGLLAYLILALVMPVEK
ncbi:MAG: PspC domain-containing protein [Bacteroidaceae bacterium]|nr:PspC domain-containing protein [Bacteroidaceae bacterium]